VNSKIVEKNVKDEAIGLFWIGIYIMEWSFNLQFMSTLWIRSKQLLTPTNNFKEEVI
jgi:hypothetical protein